MEIYIIGILSITLLISVPLALGNIAMMGIGLLSGCLPGKKEVKQLVVFLTIILVSIGILYITISPITR